MIANGKFYVSYIEDLKGKHWEIEFDREEINTQHIDCFFNMWVASRIN